MLNTVLEVEEVILLDFEANLPCEGEHHSRGLSGHVVTAPGAYMVVSPCHGPKVIQCAPRVKRMKESGYLYCALCATEHSVEMYRFVPVSDVGL